MLWPVSGADLSAILGLDVVRPGVYQQAFVHKSGVKIAGMDSYERLEFLGDSVLSLAVNEYLFTRYPDEREGFMTRLKTKLVSGACLAELAAKRRLDRHIVMNKKAIEEGWSSNPKIMEDCLEALIGCLYLDMGLEAARHFIITLIATHIDHDNLRRESNAKDALMGYCQQQKVDLPTYAMLPLPEKAHPSSAKFTIQTVVDGEPMGLGTGQTKKDAEQLSAQVALENLGVPFQHPRAFVV
ncbi:MAG: ribonuclease III [Deltaproteobacteria bacterium]|nr:MAG: ribonuclease III [Deltaproteobacteria bacterium]